MDEQGLLLTGRCRRVLAELLPERYVWGESAKDLSGENGGFHLEPQGFEAELNDVAMVRPGIESIGADSPRCH